MAFTDGGGVGTVEKFDYEAIKNERVNIETALTAALTALNEGTDAIEKGFGNVGDAMAGGSSNAISNKWNELETVIADTKYSLHDMAFKKSWNEVPTGIVSP